VDSSILISFVAQKVSMRSKNSVGVSLDHGNVETCRDRKKDQKSKRRRSRTQRIKDRICCSVCKFSVVNGRVESVGSSNPQPDNRVELR